METLNITTEMAHILTEMHLMSSGSKSGKVFFYPRELAIGKKQYLTEKEVAFSLNQLVEAGFITNHCADNTRPSGNERTCYYRITEAGKNFIKTLAL